jgi:hypothetical protein
MTFSVPKDIAKEVSLYFYRDEDLVFWLLQPQLVQFKKFIFRIP